MNDNQPSPRRARVAAITIALTGVALLAVACGGNHSSTASTATGATQYSQELAYSQCMRSHGVPSFPDPNSQGQFPPLQIGRNGVSQQSVQSAQDACRHLQPGSSSPGSAQQQAALTQALNFSKCMRAHGVPNYPDPSTVDGGIGYDIGAVNSSSLQYRAAQQACRSSNGGRP